MGSSLLAVGPVAPIDASQPSTHPRVLVHGHCTDGSAVQAVARRITRHSVRLTVIKDDVRGGQKWKGNLGWSPVNDPFAGQTRHFRVVSTADGVTMSRTFEAIPRVPLQFSFYLSALLHADRSCGIVQTTERRSDTTSTCGRRMVSLSTERRSAERVLVRSLLVPRHPPRRWSVKMTARHLPNLVQSRTRRIRTNRGVVLSHASFRWTRDMTVSVTFSSLQRPSCRLVKSWHS